MKKVILWFFLCCKRYLKRIPFLLLLAALPLTALAASRMENGKDGTDRRLLSGSRAGQPGKPVKGESPGPGYGTVLFLSMRK